MENITAPSVAAPSLSEPFPCSKVTVGKNGVPLLARFFRKGNIGVQQFPVFLVQKKLFSMYISKIKSNIYL